MPEDTDTSCIHEIPVKELESYDKQPRKHFDDRSLAELAENIVKYGIVTPLLINSKKQIISGERRFKAAQLAGLKTVPVIYKEDNVYDIAVMDNIMREDLTMIEKAEALHSLYKEQKKKNSGLTEEQFGKTYGFKKSSISEYFKIANINKKIKDMFRNEPEAALRRLKEIAAINESEKQLTQAENYKETLKGKTRTRSPIPTAAIKKVDSFLADILRVQEVQEGKKAFSNWDEDEQGEYVKKLEELERQVSEIIEKIRLPANIDTH